MEITEEQREKWRKNKEDWMEKAKTISNSKELEAFADRLVRHCSNEFEIDFYEESANSTSALAYAAIEMMARQYGLSNFQISCIMWEIIDKLVLEKHDVGMQLVNYNNMLYPQYEYRFEKTISKECWEVMQKKAKELIENDKTDPYVKASSKVLEHWKKIAGGEVPFGYTVSNK